MDDNISFYTAPDVPDHRMELKVLILSLLVRAGEVVDGTVGWDKLEVGFTRSSKRSAERC